MRVTCGYVQSLSFEQSTVCESPVDMFRASVLNRVRCASHRSCIWLILKGSRLGQSGFAICENETEIPVDPSSNVNFDPRLWLIIGSEGKQIHNRREGKYLDYSSG